MKKRSTSYWGWGFHVDLDGNLRDVFPPPEPAKEPVKARKDLPKWHVKKKTRKVLAAAH